MGFMYTGRGGNCEGEGSTFYSDMFLVLSGILYRNRSIEMHNVKLTVIICSHGDRKYPKIS